MASTRSISRSDEYKLWREASSRCSICREELFKFERNSILGEMAHIVAASKDGPRGNSELSSEERDSYQNLILLCPNHHSIIDNDETTWTVEKLHKMKKAHEEWIDIQLSRVRPGFLILWGGRYVTLIYHGFRLVLAPQYYSITLIKVFLVENKAYMN